MRSRVIADSGAAHLLSARAAVPSAILALRLRPPVVTVALICLIATTFARLQVGGQLPLLTLLDRGFSGRGLINGRADNLLSATVLTRDVFMCVSICVSLLVTLGIYEVLAGHLRALLIAVAAAALGPVLVAGGLGLLQALGLVWAGGPLGTVDVGASAIVAAAAAAIAGQARNRRLTLALLLFLIGGLLVHHQLADWEHVLVFPAGFFSGRYLGRGSHRASRMSPGRRSHRVSRMSSRRVGVYLLAFACVIAVADPLSARLFPVQRVWQQAAGAGSPDLGPLSPPRLISTSFPAPALGGRRQVLVLLPVGYDSSRASYPVIALLHGDPGSPQDFISLFDIAQSATSAEVAPFIAVMPDGRGPRVSASWYANIPGQQMGTALSVQLRDWVRATFRTDGSWSYAGLSSGGTGAAYLALIDPAPVHGVCGLSGFYDGRIPVLAGSSASQRRQASPLAHPQNAARITFLAYGQRDRSTAAQSTRFASSLGAAGKHVVLRAYPGSHTPAVWIPAFRDCFRTLLPAAKPAQPTSS